MVNGNRLRVRGYGTAVRVDGVDVAASIVDNDITVDAGSGILLETHGDDASTISQNRITAKDGSVAIHVASHSNPGKQRIEQNTISGFAEGVMRERGNSTLHE